MSNALHDYAKLFEKYAANNGGTGAILAGEDCLALANEMRMDADAIDAENTKLREEIEAAKHDLQVFSMSSVQLDADNAKLREELEQWHKLTAGIELPEYPITQFQPKDLERENAKLRELLQRALTSHDKMCTNRGTCLGCLFFNAKPFAPVCPIVSVTRDARELRIEADE